MLVLDVRTLAVVLTVIMSVSALSLLVTWRLNREVSGLGFFAAAYSCFAMGIFLLALIRVVPAFLFAFVSMILITGGFHLCLLGARHLFGREGNFLLPYSLTAGSLGLVMLYFAQVKTGGGDPILIFTTVILVQILLLAREFLRPSQMAGVSAKILGGLLLIHAAVLVLRMGAVVLYPPTGLLEDGGTLRSLIFLESIAVSIATTLGIIIVTTEKLQMELKRQAAMDPLTGIYNRRAFMTAGLAHLGHSAREGIPVALMVMDLDHFKLVNDTYGHAAGDGVLKHFVAIANKTLRSQDVLGRFGGEEFIALLPGTRLDEASHVAERLRLAVETTSALQNGFNIPVTVSIGISETGRFDQDMDGLMARADQALYEAKREGRNRVTLQELPPVPMPVSA